MLRGEAKENTKIETLKQLLCIIWIMDIYHCCYKCLIVWIDWTKVRIDLFKKLHHHTCLPFPALPKDGCFASWESCTTQLQQGLARRRSRDPLLLLFPRINHYCRSAREICRKTFQCFDRALACHHQILLFALSSKKRVSSPKMFNLLLYACVSTDYFWHY